MTTVPKILIIATSHAVLGASGQPTGLWLEELTAPYYVFTDAGAKVTIVSIDGGAVPIDPQSRRPAGQNPASVERFLKDPAAMRQIEASGKVANVSAEGFDAVFLPGGHGPMWDVATSPQVGALLGAAWARGGVVAAVCHGSAGLVNAKDTFGKPLVAGRRTAGFSNAEEQAAGTTEVVPFLLESRLRGLGARYESGPAFKSFALRDGRLVTGQNPASSEAVGRLVLEALKERAIR